MRQRLLAPPFPLHGKEFAAVSVHSRDRRRGGGGHHSEVVVGISILRWLSYRAGLFIRRWLARFLRRVSDFELENQTFTMKGVIPLR